MAYGQVEGLKGADFMSGKRPENTGDDAELKGLTGRLALLGYDSLSMLRKFFSAVSGGAMFLFASVREFFGIVAGGVTGLVRETKDSLRDRKERVQKLRDEAEAAKQGSRQEYIKAQVEYQGSRLFGEGGILYTAFNYIMPVLSIIFLIGVIRCGRGLEYGISVEMNGKQLGIIGSESDYENAEREVMQRIYYAGGDKPDGLSADFSLKVISGSDTVMNSVQLANAMLEASDEELTEAYGIYIDGEFVCAVNNRTIVQDALNDKLLNYNVTGNVKELSYKNKIEYIRGIFLKDSLMTPEDAAAMLTSSKYHKGVYIAQAGDTKASVCQKYNMDIETIENLNPGLGDNCRSGQMINVLEKENYLPVQYIREVETLSFLDYESIEVETSSLNVGSKSRIVKGERGEKKSVIEVTYVDGVERSRNIVSSEITKQPVMEQIGVGTYSARPASSDTKLYGTGEFGWPVNGGWISDPFMSDRNHKGLDIAADGGTEIYAAADGVVISAGWNAGGYGYVVMIAHADGYQTVYAHMSAVLVTEDQPVARGQLIGEVGTTGHSTGNHCHFEVRHLGICLDPASFLNTVDYAEDDKKKTQETEKNNE